jgi:pimeloyl-ACP methyl ester carboxylesterase
MGAYGFDTWACASRAIGADYRRYGSPLRALAATASPPSLLHLFSQPRAPEFLAAQEAFAREHDWFSVARLDGVSHFPPLESPAATASAIERFLT